MTREEREKAIDLLDNLIGMMEDNQGNDYDFALKKGIEALKQENVIDKIRAEIEHMTITEGGDDYVRKMAELFSFKMKVLQIIDKCKGESEEE
jgi:hypothetical protein